MLHYSWLCSAIIAEDKTPQYFYCVCGTDRKDAFQFLSNLLLTLLSISLMKVLWIFITYFLHDSVRLIISGWFFTIIDLDKIYWLALMLWGFKYLFVFLQIVQIICFSFLFLIANSNTFVVFSLFYYKCFWSSEQSLTFFVLF